MDNDYYQSLDNEIKLNGGAVDVTPNDVSIENFSEIPAPTPTSINDTQSNSSCPIEKPYYEISESNQNPELIQQPIIQSKNCYTRCFDRYDVISIYFIKIFLTNKYRNKYRLSKILLFKKNHILSKIG